MVLEFLKNTHFHCVAQWSKGIEFVRHRNSYFIIIIPNKKYLVPKDIILLVETVWNVVG